MVIRGDSVPPFEPVEIELNDKLDYDELKNDLIGLNDELDATAVQQLHGELNAVSVASKTIRDEIEGAEFRLRISSLINCHWPNTSERNLFLFQIIRFPLRINGYQIID